MKKKKETTTIFTYIGRKQGIGKSHNTIVAAGHIIGPYTMENKKGVSESVSKK